MIQSCYCHSRVYVAFAISLHVNSTQPKAANDYYQHAWFPLLVLILFADYQSTRIILGVASEVGCCLFGVYLYFAAFLGAFAYISILIFEEFAESGYRDLEESYYAFQFLRIFDSFHSKLIVIIESACLTNLHFIDSDHFRFTSSALSLPFSDKIASIDCIFAFLQQAFH